METKIVWCTVPSDDIELPQETAGLAPQGDTIESTLTDPLIGSTLAGHLQILSCVGRGGMSVVYKAKDLLLYRTVAVKVLRSHSAVPKGIKRFRYEAVAASKLDHPNIVRVYKFNVPEQGQPYLVMDYLEGSSLAEFIAKNGAIELRRTISIMTKVCEGLEHAHKAGVIHRDLKPGNIMLVKDQDGQQSVKIVDFGIAKMLHNEDEDSPSLTRTGDLVGSPLYMSPEQCHGEPVDKRSDIYALGCVMYEMLTGKPPFKGNTMLETVQMQTSAIPKPVKERFPGIKNADKIDTILLKAMAKQPAQRYQSVHDFKAAIQELNAGSGASGLLDRIKLQLELARNKSIAQKKEKLAPYSLILAAVASIAIVICIFISNQALHRQSHNATPMIAPSPPSNRPAENPELSWINADLAAQEAVNTGQYKTAEQEYEKSKKLAKNIGTEYELSTLEGLSDLYDLTSRDRKVYEKDIDRLVHKSMDTQIIIDALRKTDAHKERDSVLALLDQSIRLSGLLNLSGRCAESQKMLKTTLEIGQRYLMPNDLTIATCLLSLGDTCHRTNFEAEREYLQKAYAIAKKHPKDELFERCAYLLGRSYAEHNEPKLAEPYLQEALKASITIHGASSKQSAQSCYQLAKCYMRTKTQALSNTTAYEALSMLQSLKPEARDAESDYQLAQLESGLRRKGDALRDASRSLRACENGPAKNYPMIVQCCQLLAFNYPKTSPQRVALLNRRTAILKRMNQFTPVDEAEIHRSQVESYLESGEYGKAKSALQPSIDLVNGWPKEKPVPRQLTRSLLTMARVYRGLGDQNEAEIYCLRYKALATASNGAKSYSVATADAQLGHIYAEGNQREKAIAQIIHYLQFCKTYQPTPEQLGHFNKERVEMSKLLAELQKSPLPNNGKNIP